MTRHSLSRAYRKPQQIGLVSAGQGDDVNARGELRAKAMRVGVDLLGDDLVPAQVGDALLRAADEGRLHPDLAREIGVETGQYECAICGMRKWTEDDATKCCRGLLLGESMAIADPYGERKRHYGSRSAGRELDGQAWGERPEEALRESEAGR